MRAIDTPTRAGRDRWLLSYADLVTLLFAFFTTMYAAGAVGADNKGRVAAAEADRGGGAEAGDGARAGEADRLQDRLTSRLEDDVRLQRADIVRDGRGVVVSLPERATFDEGSADVSTQAQQVIRRVAGELEGQAYVLRIEGHTDNRPIRTPRFPSNWELSTARAGAVVAYLVNELGFPPERLSAAGYGEFHPRVPNDSPDNRARNRRIDIVVIPTERAGSL